MVGLVSLGDDDTRVLLVRELRDLLTPPGAPLIILRDLLTTGLLEEPGAGGRRNTGVSSSSELIRWRSTITPGCIIF